MRPLRLLSLFIVTAFAKTLPAQGLSTPLATIRELFDGMRAGSEARVAATFHPQATFFSVQDGPAGAKVSPLSPGDFAESVGTWAPGFGDERFGRTTVRQEGSLASVWMRYQFYSGGTFRHCGSENFTLIEAQPGQWRILSGADTRQTEGCPALDDAPDVAALDTLMDRWHRAASTADEETFFGTMSADGIYLGTDRTERWVRDSMAAWAAPYFQRDVAWAFTPIERQWYLSDDGEVAWFEEHLDSPHMGVVRGSGVLTKVAADGGTASGTASGTGSGAVGGSAWELRHYNLALAVPNDRMDAVQAAIDSTRVRR